MEGTRTQTARYELSMHPAVDIDLVAFILRDVERIAIRIEAAVLGHRPAARSLADAAFRQRVEKMLDVIDQPAEVVETVPRAFPFIHVAARAIRQDRHCGGAIRRPAHHSVLRTDFFAGSRFAKPKNVNVKVEHVVVVRYAHSEMADTGKSSLDALRVERVTDWPLGSVTR